MYGQPQVSSASVNLTTETAVVWPVSDAKSIPDWQKTVGTELAKHLTSCGFQSNLRGKLFFLSALLFNCSLCVITTLVFTISIRLMISLML